MEHQNGHNGNGIGHETKEVSVPFVFASLTALIIGAFLAAMLAIGIFQFFKNTYHPEEAAKASRQVIPPAPRLDAHPAEELRSIHAREDHILSTYAVIDPKQGIVRVPIDRAIDMLAQKGLPTHNYLDDILAGRKAPVAAQPASQRRLQGSINVP
jgi:hypothetical protein